MIHNEGFEETKNLKVKLKTHRGIFAAKQFIFP